MTMTKLWLLLIALSAPLLLLMCGDSEPDEPIVPTPTASATATPLPIVTRMSAATPAPRATRPAKPTPEPSPTPTPTVDDVAALATISPEEVFAAAFEAMAEVASFHFGVQATIKPHSEDLDFEIPLAFVGEFQAPDRVHGKLTLSMAFFSMGMDTITIGDTTYNTNIQTGEWEKSVGLSSAIPSPVELARDGTQSVGDAVAVGLTTFDGVPVVRLRTRSPPGIFGHDDASWAEFWIGKDGFLIRQIVAEGEIPLEGLGDALTLGGISGTATLSLTMRLSDFDEPVSIKAPIVPWTTRP